MESDKRDRGFSYREFKIEPITFIEENNLSFNVGNIIKYVTRKKNNRLDDLMKAMDYLQREIKKEQDKPPF